MRRQLLARFHWLCGRLADYQMEPAAAVQELQACLLLCQGRSALPAEPAHHSEGHVRTAAEPAGQGIAEGAAEGTAEGLAAASEVPEVRLRLAGCRHDAEVSARATTAKLEALRVSSASAEGLGRLQVRATSGEPESVTFEGFSFRRNIRVLGIFCCQCKF